MSNPVAAWPWSFSKIKAFEQCPAQFYEERVLKRFPQAETKEMRYGTDWHQMAEDYIGKGTTPEDRFERFTPLLDKFKAMPGTKMVEQKVGLTATLQPCSFSADNVWFLGIADLNILNGKKGRTVDWKTGKSANYADKGQLELMALAMFAHYPQIEEVQAALVFPIAKAMPKAEYKKSDIPRLWSKWLNKYMAMEAAFHNNVWNEHQGKLCRKHCPVIECPHNGRS
jgi:hypothetical protein